MALGITIPPFNLTSQISVIQRYSDLSNPGWLEPVRTLYGGMAPLLWILIILFTLGIVYIRTESPSAMAYTVLLFSALFVIYIPGFGLKIAYLIVILTVAGMFYYVFGRE